MGVPRVRYKRMIVGVHIAYAGCPIPVSLEIRGRIHIIVIGWPGGRIGLALSGECCVYSQASVESSL